MCIEKGYGKCVLRALSAERHIFDCNLTKNGPVQILLSESRGVCVLYLNSLLSCCKVFGMRLKVGVLANSAAFVFFLEQDHARAILPHLQALSGTEGADGWIRTTMDTLNACARETGLR